MPLAPSYQQWFQTLLSISGAEPRTFQPRTLLLDQGARPDGLLVLQAGVVRVFVQVEGGQEISLSLLGPSDIVGEVAVLDGHPRTTSVQALTEVRALYLDREQVLAEIDRQPDLRLLLMAVLSERLRQADDLLVETASLPVRVRLARRLLTLAERFAVAQEPGGRVVVHAPLRQYELATMVPGRRETVNREFSALCDDGYIEGAWPHFTILDIERLRQLSRPPRGVLPPASGLTPR